MKKIITSFEIEKNRADLAKKVNYNSLKKLYSSSFPAIDDFNTDKLWDALNTKNKMVRNPMDEDRIRKVSKLIKGINLKILNIGFGSGSLEKEYFNNNSARNFNWFGVDISSVSVKKVADDFPNGKFKKGNILNLTYDDNTFDYVISLEVLEHIKPSNTFQALHEVYRVVKPGKYFIISVPLNEGLEGMISRGENPNAHVRVYTSELIKAELTIAGFKILETKKLYAFHNFYKLKTIIATYILRRQFNHNDIIILTQKQK